MADVILRLSVELETRLQALVDAHNAQTGQTLTLAEWIRMELRERVLNRLLALYRQERHAEAMGGVTTATEAERVRLMALL